MFSKILFFRAIKSRDCVLKCYQTFYDYDKDSFSKHSGKRRTFCCLVELKITIHIFIFLPTILYLNDVEEEGVWWNHLEWEKMLLASIFSFLNKFMETILRWGLALPITFEWKVIEILYFTCVFLMVRPKVTDI